MAQWPLSFCWIVCASSNGLVEARNIVNNFQLTPEVISRPGAVNLTTLLASSRRGSRNVPPNVREILERHARREKAKQNATPGADETLTLRAEAVGLIDEEYDAMLEHVAQSLAGFVQNKTLERAPKGDMVAFEEATILAVADELEPRFDRMNGLVGGLFDKAKPHKRREFVADLKKYVPDYCKGQHDRIPDTIQFHMEWGWDDKKFKKKLEKAGKYIESGMEDYIELSYYSNLMLHGRNASQLNQAQLHELAVGFKVQQNQSVLTVPF